MRLEVEYAVPTATFAPRVQRGSIPGPPGAIVREPGLVIDLLCVFGPWLLNSDAQATPLFVPLQSLLAV